MIGIDSEVLAELNAETLRQKKAIWNMTLTGWVALADELGIRRTDRDGAARILALHVLRTRGVIQ